MSNHWQDFLIIFVPLFFAIDAPGIVPMFISLTHDLSLADQRKLLRNAILAAFIVSTVILVTGKIIFDLMGITADDFRVGGGLVLLLIGILDLLSSQYETRRKISEATPELGIVPIGIPLIIGPGALTTIMVGVDRSGYAITLIALLLNLGITWLIFHNSFFFVRIMGRGGARAFGKVASLFLVAIAVMLIRTGVKNFF